MSYFEHLFDVANGIVLEDCWRNLKFPITVSAAIFRETTPCILDVSSFIVQSLVLQLIFWIQLFETEASTL